MNSTTEKIERKKVQKQMLLECLQSVKSMSNIKHIWPVGYAISFCTEWRECSLLVRSVNFTLLRFSTHPTVLLQEAIRTELLFLRLEFSEYGCTTSEVNGGEDTRYWAALEEA